LPDGKVLVTGGTSGPGVNNTATPVFAAEMRDPATESWTTMASAQAPRLYHSAALLLPDGRVLTTGGDDITQVELYSPPYLFAGARPTITSAPAVVSFGQSYFVETPDAANIAKVRWIRLGSVTHAFNMNQRINSLSFSQAPGGLNVVSPSNPNLAPPGHYLLFILNANGVPSIAKIVQLGSSTAPDPTPPTVSMTAPVNGDIVAGTAVTLSATAADNVGVAGVQFKLDGTTNLGAEDTTFPYSVAWNSTTATNGLHTLTAVARDAAGNTTISAGVSVTVNNTGPALPDVIVTSLSYAGGVFTSAVKNQGTAATPAGIAIGVAYSVDGVYRTWGGVTGPLAAGASVTIGTNGGPYTIPNGSHTIMAFVDDENRFAESDETNNKLSRLITAAAPDTLPDVIVTSLSYASGIFTSTVKNQGTAATPAGTDIGVAYSVDGVYRTWGGVSGPLAAGASVT